jgi:hypothetical protein
MAKQKRASLPDDTFSKGNALDRLTSADPYHAPVAPVEEEQKPTKLKKSSIYLTEELEQKLDDLAHEYRRATGSHTNKQDIIRMLIEKATLAALLEQ